MISFALVPLVISDAPASGGEGVVTLIQHKTIQDNPRSPRSGGNAHESIQQVNSHWRLLTISDVPDSLEKERWPNIYVCVCLFKTGAKNIMLW